MTKFLLISIYFILLPRLLESSGFLQRSDKGVIFLFWVRVMGVGGGVELLIIPPGPSQQGLMHWDN